MILVILVIADVALTRITGLSFGNSKVFLLNDEKDRIESNRIISDWKKWWHENTSKTKVDWLIEALDSGSFENAKSAALLLGRLNDQSAVPPLINLIKNGNSELTFYAVESLALLSSMTAVPYLVVLYLANDNLEYRKKGIKYLKRLTGNEFDYDASATIRSRNKVIEKWNNWLRTKNNK